MVAMVEGGAGGGASGGASGGGVGRILLPSTILRICASPVLCCAAGFS